MYNAEKFIRDCPMLRDGGVVRRLEEERLLPLEFGGREIVRLARWKKCSSSERCCIDFALSLYDPSHFKCNVGQFLMAVSDHETLAFAADWLIKGPNALD